MQSNKHEEILDQVDFLVRDWSDSQRSGARGHSWFVEKSFSVTKVFESFISSVSSITTISDTSKSLVVTNHLHKTVINT